MKRTRKQTPISPTGLCLDERQGLMVIADYSADGAFDIHRAVIGERRAVNITSNHLRTVVHNAAAHTQIATVPVTTDDSDETILSNLIESVPRDHVIANFTRGDNAILVTQADELAISETNQKMEEWLETQQPTHVTKMQYVLRVETRTRAIARTWNFTDSPREGSVAFLVLGYDDYGLALWSNGAGLVFENEEHLEAGASLQIKCNHAAERLASMVDTATSEHLGIPPVTHAVISAPADCQDLLINLLQKNQNLSHIEITPISLADNQGVMTPIDQPAALAIGAMLDDPAIPSCDLNITLAEQLEAIRAANSNAARVATQARAARALVALLLPLVVVFAFAITSYGDRLVERAKLEARIKKEEAIGKQLTKENADYESSKTNFAAFHSLLDNLTALRRRQPAMEQLLRDLNQRWPHETSWFISEINVKGQSVEIKGKTKNEQAITAFAKSLEFSDGLFTNILAKNNLQGAASTAAAQPPQSNVVEFTVNATYTPLASPSKPLADPANAQQQQPAAPQLPQTIPVTTPRQPATAPPPVPAMSPQVGVN